jgi:hypothetical protein
MLGNAGTIGPKLSSATNKLTARMNTITAMEADKTRLLAGVSHRSERSSAVRAEVVADAAEVGADAVEVGGGAAEVGEDAGQLTR